MLPGDYRERVIDLSVPYDADVMYSVKGAVVSDATPTMLPGVSQAGDALNSMNGTNAGLLASDLTDVNAPAGQGGLFVEIYRCAGGGNAYESTAGAIAARTDDREVSCRNAGVPQGPKGNGTAVTQTDVAAISQFSMISSGLEHACGIRWDTTMWCWGNNTDGQIGDGSTTIRAVPVQVGAGSSWATVSAGGRHTCARQTNNTLWCWGQNYRGQVGDGTTSQRLTPTQVNADVNWTSLVTGSAHTCALKTTGTLWCWGGNGDAYALGTNLGSEVNVPTQIGSNTTWSSLSSSATGATTCATRTNNTLWCWGANYTGQVGIGTADPEYGVMITQVGVATTWSQVSNGGGHTCAVQTDGSLWCWGANSSGQLGLGTTVDQYSPVRVGVGNSWAAVAAGANSTCARRVDSTLWCWGANDLGQVGDGTYNNASAPVNVGVSNSWLTVSLGGGFACANSIQGSTFCWGSNLYSQLGNSESFPKRIPARIGSSTNWSTIDSSYDHTCAITSTNTLWCWGYNFFGQVGIGTSGTDQYIPAQVGTDTNWLGVSAGSQHTCAIKTTGTMWCWGAGSFGRLGNGGTANSTTPVQAGTDTDWTQVTAGEEHTCATKSTGTLWCWGRNDNYALGPNQWPDRLVPTQVDTDTDWSRVATGNNHTCALKTTGTLWCWGANTNNQLGIAGGSSGFPRQVGSATDWTAIDAGAIHNCALRTTGTLWCWGYNAYGAIGNGTTTNGITPTQVGTDTNWTNVDTGYAHTCARRNNGAFRKPYGAWVTRFADQRGATGLAVFCISQLPIPSRACCALNLSAQRLLQSASPWSC